MHILHKVYKYISRHSDQYQSNFTIKNALKLIIWILIEFEQGLHT